MRATDRRRLGTTEVEVTGLGLGTAPIGGMFTAVSDEAALATVRTAYELGIRYFDTAPHYGAGLSESRLGTALDGLPRQDFTVSTKFGRSLVAGEQEQQFWAQANGLRSEFDFSAPAVEASRDQSLTRLGLDRIDLALLHDPDDHFTEAMTGAYPTLAAWRAAGEVGAVGAGMNQAPMLVELAEAGEFDAFLIAGRYNLLDQTALPELLPLCARSRISIIAAGVFHAGLLADPDNPAAMSYLPNSGAYREKALAIRAVCDRHDVPLRAAAIQFPAAHPAVATVVVGARTPSEAQDAVAMYEYDVPPGLWHDLKAADLIPDSAPTP